MWCVTISSTTQSIATRACESPEETVRSVDNVWIWKCSLCLGGGHHEEGMDNCSNINVYSEKARPQEETYEGEPQSPVPRHIHVKAKTAFDNTPKKIL